MPARRASSSVAFGGDFVAVLGRRGVDVWVGLAAYDDGRGRDFSVDSAEAKMGT